MIKAFELSGISLELPFFEEGINNIPLKMITTSEKVKIELWAEKTMWSNSVDHNIFQLTTQIAWSPLHKEYLKYCIKNCDSKQIAEKTITT